MGNRLTKTENGITTSYVYDLCNKLLSETTNGVETSYTYDARGNLTAKVSSEGTTTYAYNALNQLTEVVNQDGTWQSSTYDASGIRSMIAENGVTTEFMTYNGLVLSGYNKSGEQTEHYYYGNSLLAAEYVSAEDGLYYYLKNSHGDVIGLTDNTGTLTETYRYDAFGMLNSIQSLNENGVMAEVETAISKFLYAGEQHDEVTGLYYLRARQYDTVIGRFTQEDTYLGDGRNLYVYVNNNPLKYVDPSGCCSKEVGYGNYSDYNTLLNVLNAGFTCPDSYVGYCAQQWGIYIAPTIQNDPEGSAYAFKEGFLDSIIPFRSSNDYFYTDVYLTGQMFGMIVTGGISEYFSGISTEKNIQIFSYSPSYSIAGGGSCSVAIAGTIDVAAVAEGIAGAYFGYSVGSTLTSAFEELGNAVDNSGNSNPWDTYTNQIKNSKINVSKWNKGSFNSVEESLARHYYKHAEEVNASSLEQYVRKAEGFMQNLRGATKSYVNGAVEGVIRYKKNGKYIDIAPDGTIISFGITK